MGKAGLFMYIGFFASIGGMVALAIVIGIISLAAAIFNNINGIRYKQTK